MDKFNTIMKEIDPNVYIVKYNSEKKNLERCKIYLVDCQIFKPQGEQLSNLLEGELRIDKTNYQYIGSDINLANLSKEESLKIIDLKPLYYFWNKVFNFKKTKIKTYSLFHRVFQEQKRIL